MTASVQKYSVGDIVSYKDSVCVINDVVQNVLGYQTYVICDLDTGEISNVAKHTISSVECVSIDEEVFPQMLWDNALDVDEQFKNDDFESVVESESVPQKKKRHVEMSAEEIDAVAKKRLSDSTEKQTKWAVYLLKGEYNIIIVYVVSIIWNSCFYLYIKK
jgi:hypothetical protein